MREKIITASLFAMLLGGLTAAFCAHLSLAVGLGGLVLAGAGLLVGALACCWPR